MHLSRFSASPADHSPRREDRGPNSATGRARIAAVAVLALVAVIGFTATAAYPSAAAGPILLSRLNGAVTPLAFTLQDDTAGVTQAKFYVTTHGTVFVATDKTAPFTVDIDVAAGPNSVAVRHVVGGVETRPTATFVAGSSTASAPTTPITSSPTTPSPTSSAPSTTPPGNTVVTTSAQLASALASARAGTTIQVADGTYQNTKGNRWLAAADATAARPITLIGSRNAILESDSPSGDYGLSITGDYWHISGLTVRNASKGVVLDGSIGTVLDNIEVYNIGDEGVHFRACSSNDVLKNSYIHDTGVQAPQYGEGVYVGSANSNWSKYNCTDGRDNSENNVINNNVFRNNAAEGADLKEGTDSGTLTGNTFINTGFSGQNSADSAVDVKGNNWTISGNTVEGAQGSDSDAFQTHTVYTGYGTNNVFSSNKVEGTWPGFGFGLYPKNDNVVTCSNTAPAATQGLVGSNGQAIACGG